MDKNYLEDRMKNELPDHEVFINTDELWKDIQGDQKKKRRPILPLIFLLACMAGGLVFWQAGKFQDTEQVVNVLKENTASIANNNDETKDSDDDTASFKLGVHANDKDQKTVLNTTDKIEVVKQQEFKKEKSISKRINTELDKITTRKNDFQQTEKKQIIQQRIVQSQKDVVEANPELIIKNKVEVKEENKLIENFQAIEKTSSMDTTDDGESDSEKPSIENNLPIQEFKKETTSDKEIKLEPSQSKPLENSVKSEPAEEQDVAQKEIASEQDRDQKEGVETDALKKSSYSSQKKFKFVFNPYVGYGYPIKNFEGLESDIEDARSIERPLENVSFGAMIKLQHQSGFAVGVGINYSSLQEEIIFSEVIDTQALLQDHLVSTTTNSDGSITNLQEDIMIDRTIYTDYEVYNTYTRLDIPIVLSYEKRKNRFSILCQTEAHINLTQKFNGFIFRKSEDSFLMEQNPDLFAQNLGLDFYLSLGLGYHFEKYTIRLSPFVQLDQVNVSKQENDFKQLYRFVGVRVGVEL